MRRLFPAALILAALVAGAAAAPIAPASADSYNDTTTGIYVATPDDFSISRGIREGYALALHINPTGSYPNRVEGESRLCGLYFKAVPSSRDAAMVQFPLEGRGVAGGCAAPSRARHADEVGGDVHAPR